MIFQKLELHVPNNPQRPHSSKAFAELILNCGTGPKNEKGLKSLKALISLVPRAGIEPARCFQRGILSPVRLPIPPSRQRSGHYPLFEASRQHEALDRPGISAIRETDCCSGNRLAFARDCPTGRIESTHKRPIRREFSRLSGKHLLIQSLHAATLLGNALRRHPRPLFTLQPDLVLQSPEFAISVRNLLRQPGIDQAKLAA
jgi:hypothetical protein